MIKIDNVEFKAVSYIGATANETWIFAAKPILKDDNELAKQKK